MNRFIYIYFFLTQGLLYSQGLTGLINEENSFDNYNFSQANLFYYETVQKFDPLTESHNLDISSENKLKWTMYNGDTKEIRFNNDGKVFLQKEIYVGNDIQSEFNYQFSQMMQFCVQPESVEKESFENLSLYETKLFTLIWWDQPTYFQLSKFRKPKYNKRGKIVGA